MQFLFAGRSFGRTRSMPWTYDFARVVPVLPTEQQPDDCDGEAIDDCDGKAILRTVSEGMPADMSITRPTWSQQSGRFQIVSGHGSPPIPGVPDLGIAAASQVEDEEDTCSSSSSRSSCSVHSAHSIRHLPLWETPEDIRTTSLDCKAYLDSGRLNGAWRIRACDGLSRGFAVWLGALRIERCLVVLGDGTVARLEMSCGQIKLEGGRLVRIGDTLMRFGKTATQIYERLNTFDDSRRTSLDCELDLDNGLLDGVWRLDSQTSDCGLAEWMQQLRIDGRFVQLGTGEIIQLQLRGGHISLEGGEVVRIGGRLIRFGKSSVQVYNKRDGARER
eukprot:TRINITY_DN14709_c0_g1_i1.p1 TRINITY_DN14709_c0_g1~~TRINITY_DN14709_c0_g1_i1.p1  ORF type:complete len:332 (+),score=12.99 TRINITY_DN14709_c0_g1_i1:81-1076(+)